MKTINVLVMIFTGVCAAASAEHHPARSSDSGIALLASDVGQHYSVDDLVAFVESAKFNHVIVDWAWITAHWNKTDFASVRQLVRRLNERKIRTAAMYRPRFLDAPNVPEQVNADGKAAFAHGRYPCYSSGVARQWSARWGEQILERCPEFDQVIVYNPLDLCQCESCHRAKIQNVHDPVWNFLAEAKAVWRTKKASVGLGVVFNPDPEFWSRGKNICDTAWPFFHVREDADFPRSARDIMELRNIVGNKAHAALAKVTWGSEDRLSPRKLSEFRRVAHEHNIGWVLWTFETLFLSQSNDPEQVANALRLDYRALEAPLRKLRGTTVADASHAQNAPKPPADAIPSLTFPAAQPDIRKLPWPHQPPGLSAVEIEQLNRAVWVINNNPLYQADESGNWAYFHGGLDIVLTNGTKIYAIEDGWVKCIVNSAITIAGLKTDAACYGWSYAHLDKFRVREGDFVRQGTLIGEVNFHGLPHTHLDKVFSEGEYWRSWRYVCFPDDHFSFHDNEPPVIQTPFHFFENNSENVFVPRTDGVVAVRGDIDIVVSMRDGGEVAHSKDGGFGDRLAVTRIEYTIRPAIGGKDQAGHFHSFDFRKLRIRNGVEGDARSYNTRLAKVVFKHYALFGKPLSGHQNLAHYIISNCPADDAPTELQFAFTNHCWQTAARDTSGARLYPDGEYIVEVTAFDSHDNRASQFMKVRVDNTGQGSIVAKPITPSQLTDREPDVHVANRPQPAAARGEVTSDEIRRITVEGWMDLIGEKEAEAGYAPFTALNTLPQKAKENDETREKIIRMAGATIDDTSQNIFKRWQCCYVLSSIGDERGIPAVKRALKDQNETVRSVAACALGQFDHSEARAALEEASSTESASSVKEAIQKALRGEFARKTPKR